MCNEIFRPITRQVREYRKRWFKLRSKQFLFAECAFICTVAFVQVPKHVQYRTSRFINKPGRRVKREINCRKNFAIETFPRICSSRVREIANGVRFSASGLRLDSIRNHSEQMHIQPIVLFRKQRDSQRFLTTKTLPTYLWCTFTSTICK